MGRFLSCIERFSVVSKVEDKLKWEETKDGVFSVKSMYLALSSIPYGVFPMVRDK